jgi:3-ketosteroid 9alpha-monooxygenase subunit A
VVEGGIQCPFHGWVWSGGDGRNVRIPYEPHADDASRVRCWPTAEFNECIYVWHDLQHRAPRWPAPDAWGGLEDRIGSHWFRPVGPDEKQFFAGVTVHPQVVAESSVDRQHYQFVHKVPVSPRVLAATADASSWHTTIGFGGGNPVEICWHGIGLSFSCEDNGDGMQIVSICPTPVDDVTTDIFATYGCPRPSTTTTDCARPNGCCPTTSTSGPTCDTSTVRRLRRRRPTTSGT